MHSTAKELRFNTKELLDSVARGEEVIITFRGKPSAKLVPIKETKKAKNKEKDKENELFGIWRDRKDITNVNDYVRNLRKGRKHAND